MVNSGSQQVQLGACDEPNG